MFSPGFAVWQELLAWHAKLQDLLDPISTNFDLEHLGAASVRNDVACCMVCCLAC